MDYFHFAVVHFVFSLFAKGSVLGLTVVKNNNVTSSVVGSSVRLENNDNNELSPMLVPGNGGQHKENVVFNICCGKQQRFNTVKNECVDVNITLSKSVEFVLNNFVVDSNMGHSFILYTQFKYDYNLQNTCLNGEIISFEWRKKSRNYHFIDQETGKLFELNRNTKKISSVFSTRNYCIDQAVNEGSYVGLVCPCLEKICIPKCCEKGFYFNTVLNKCEQEYKDDIPNYQAEVYDTSKELNNKDVYGYYLIHRKPACPLEKFIKNHSELRPLYVQANGYLMARLEEGKEYEFFDNQKYCIDMFSSGNESNTFVNGFYCSLRDGDNRENLYDPLLMFKLTEENKSPNLAWKTNAKFTFPEKVSSIAYRLDMLKMLVYLLSISGIFSLKIY